MQDAVLSLRLIAGWTVSLPPVALVVCVLWSLLMYYDKVGASVVSRQTLYISTSCRPPTHTARCQSSCPPSQLSSEDLSCRGSSGRSAWLSPPGPDWSSPSCSKQTLGKNLVLSRSGYNSTSTSTSQRFCHFLL